MQLDTRAKLYVRDFWGRAEKKRSALLASLDISTWDAEKRKESANKPEGPREYNEFLPSEKNGWKFTPGSNSGFEDWPALDELFVTSFQGVNPNRGLDGSVIDIKSKALEDRMKDYFSKKSFDELQMRYPVLCEGRARYQPENTRDRLLKLSSFTKDKILPYMLFPFDSRWIYYEPEAKLLNEARAELGEHLGDNEFLIRAPQPRRVSESRPLLLGGLFDLHLHDWGSVGFPAEVNPQSEIGPLFKPANEGVVRSANLRDCVWSQLSKAWGLKGDLRGKDAKALTRSIFRYCMAIVHAPQYELDHKDSLSQDWPHVPICKDKTMFREVAKLGHSVVQLLDPANDASGVLAAKLGKDRKALAVPKRVGGGNVKESDLHVTFSYYGGAAGRWSPRAPGQAEALPPNWGQVTGDLFLNERVFLTHVPEQVWRYELGGYPVLKKWLGYRQANRRANEPLALLELDQLREMIHRIAALLVLRAELDAAYVKGSANAWSIDELQAEPALNTTG